ncbi:MAG: type III-B CRISPR module-associated protein Cmr3 [Desulfobacteraceae bacterium]
MAFMTIKPKDTLFFRGGKPFTAGENSWTDSSFLPNPSVIWGAMFSVLFSEKKICRKNPSKEAERLKIENIYLYNEKNQTVLIPAPLDIFTDDYGKFYLPEYEEVDFVSNYPMPFLAMVKNKKVKPLENAFIDVSSLFNHYSRNYSGSMIVYRSEKIFVPDSKIGIKRTYLTKASEEKYLYRIDLTQFKQDWSFLVEYQLSDATFSSDGLLKLGGEGKTAYFKKIEKPKTLVRVSDYKKNILKSIKDEEYFKIVFKTPCYFCNGWETNVKPLCASIGKPLNIGGFDMAANDGKGMPKPMKRYVPGGSVYIFETKYFDESTSINSEDAFKGFGKYEVLNV